MGTHAATCDHVMLVIVESFSTMKMGMFAKKTRPHYFKIGFFSSKFSVSIQKLRYISQLSKNNLNCFSR